MKRGAKWCIAHTDKHCDKCHHRIRKGKRYFKVSHSNYHFWWCEECANKEVSNG